MVNAIIPLDQGSSVKDFFKALQTQLVPVAAILVASIRLPTIILLAPAGFTLCEGLQVGARVRMGSPLMRLPPHV